MSGFKGSVMNPAPGRDLGQYGEIRSFPVGSRWASRREVCDSGVHCSLSSGIHGRGETGAFSIVLSGGYADDVDMGEEFTYTGQGGQAHRDPGKKWENVQVRDQEWKLGNLALRTSCQKNKPVRVIRGSGLKSPYAPVEGYRYDGLYFVKEAYKKPGISGFDVCLFRLVRCPNQEPLPGPIATLPLQTHERMRSLSIPRKPKASSSTQQIAKVVVPRRVHETRPAYNPHLAQQWPAGSSKGDSREGTGITRKSHEPRPPYRPTPTARDQRSMSSNRQESESGDVHTESRGRRPLNTSATRKRVPSSSREGDSDSDDMSMRSRDSLPPHASSSRVKKPAVTKKQVERDLLKSLRFQKTKN